ncbi:group III truncated hemoglobin [Bdellovibrio reynosensis]|uniref:Group III truncated hemoglobin n=1 Tax=Bdellovibrio reynosensis TaxID=2835041 RepID=A0ABY4C8T8_9BACT|nr:group III truncated hemoglobin [Bdellovibrio reynosensis]UOF01350.1 group III truncated hemoglobin [Bdellovibrio reynosensis]
MTQGKPQDDEAIIVNGISFSHKDIFDVVDDFYTRIQNDPALKVPFQSVHDWPEHIERLTHFWWARFGGRIYLFNDYNPVAKHFYAGFNRELLTRWLEIFGETLATHLKPDQAKLWKMIAERMGESLSIRNDLLKEEFAALKDKK